MAYRSSALQRTWGKPCVGPWATVELYGGARVTVDALLVEAVTAMNAIFEAYDYKARQRDSGAQNCRPVGGTNSWSWHCLTGDTLVVTYDGLQPISDLAEHGFATVLTRDPTQNGDRGHWVDVPVQSYGVEHVHSINLSRHGRKKTIRATPGHRWFVERPTSKYQGNYRSKHAVHTSEVATNDLKPGDRLASCMPRVMSRITPSPYGIAHGIVFGDGYVVSHQRGRSGDSCSVTLWGKKVELLRYFPESSPQSETELDTGVVGMSVRALPNHFKSLPPLSESSSYLAGWLAGLIATDGHVSASELRLCSVDRAAIDMVRTVAARLGIATREPYKQVAGAGSYGTSDTWTVSFVAVTVPDWLFIRSDQSDAWNEAREGRSPGWKVESVELQGTSEEVFCATVEDTGAFALDGWVLTGNSWGAAVDVNWSTNPHRRPLTTDRPAAMNRAIVSVRTNNGKQVWIWGGYWSTPDAMHVNAACTPQDLATGINWATVARKAGTPIPGPKPPPYIPPPDEEDEVQLIRSDPKQGGNGAVIAVDGIWRHDVKTPSDHTFYLFRCGNKQQNVDKAAFQKWLEGTHDAQNVNLAAFYAKAVAEKMG